MKENDIAIELLQACEALLEDVRARFPGENLRCPYLIRIDEILNQIR